MEKHRLNSRFILKKVRRVKVGDKFTFFGMDVEVIELFKNKEDVKMVRMESTGTGRKRYVSFPLSSLLKYFRSKK